jgi:uncharacterized protein (TIGR03085 family)
VTHSRDERLALAALLEDKGPDAPTLCAGWTTGDLAAHLVLRESRPDAAAGVMGGPLAPYTARMQQRLAASKSYAELVAAFRDGPPRLSVFAIPRADEAANTVEYFVHHEDVLRGGGEWEPRELSAGLTEALWKRLKGARMFLRKLPAGVELTREDAPGASPYRIHKGGSPHVVTVTGTPAELTLWVMGRVTASRVRFDGPKAAINSLQAWGR